MADPAALPLIGGLFSLAVVALLLLVAAFLAFVPPATTPKRLFALLLGVAATAIVAAALPPGTDTLALDPPERFGIDLNLLRSFVLLAFLWVWPAPPKAKSWHGAAFAFALAFHAITTYLWLFDRTALFTVLASGEERRTEWYLFLVGNTAVPALLFASSLARAVRLPAGEVRGAAAVACAAVAPMVFVAGREIITYLTQPAAYIAAFPYGLWALQRVPSLSLVLVLVLVVALRRRAFAGAAVAGLGVLYDLAAAPVVPEVFYDIVHVLMALGVTHAILRHGAMATPHVPPALQRGVMLAVFLAVFLAGNAFGLSVAGDTGPGVSMAIFTGLVLGSLAAVAVAPAGLAMAPAAASAGPQRLGPYRAALQAELARGTTPDEAAERLRPLRAELGVSDVEHAALAFALRSEGPAAGPAGLHLAPGARFLGRYRMDRALGEGGSGTAWLCHDEVVDRAVVIKRIRALQPTREALGEVLREARLLAAVRHPNVVALHDVVEVGQEAFIVMEHVEGGSLADRLRGKALPGPAFRHVADDLLSALGAVHAAGMVHRDVKPSNVLLTREGRAKLADFGVAHIPGFETTAGEDGGAVGTVRFMSPEQAKGRRATPRSDLYSAGATLFEAWTGEPYLQPREGESAVELQMRAASVEGFDRRVRGGPALGAWFARALDPEPGARFGDAGEMQRALAGALDGGGRRHQGAGRKGRRTGPGAA